jgi:hypothetical protein
MAHTLESAFERMGARLKLAVAEDRLRGQARWSAPRGPLALDIRQDERGEYFDLAQRPDVTVQVVDVQPHDRHLVLWAAERWRRSDDSAFLCGHDERHWFVAAIPEDAHAADVQAAKDALKPAEVWEAMRQHGVPADHRDRRRTAAFIRQGEWFFIPRPELRVSKAAVRRDEPIRRGAGKPHQCQFLYRIAGEQVYVCDVYPDGLAEAEYFELSHAERRSHLWRHMVRGARVFVKGNIRHPDHKTAWLCEWHEVVMNRETEAKAMQHVAFLD